MANAVEVKKDQKPERSTPTRWEPFESLRREVDRMFEDFGRGFGFGSPLSRSMLRPSSAFEGIWGKAPAVDVCERENEYEITAELPGLDASNVDVKLSEGVLTIKGEKEEKKEEQQKDYHVSERRYGSFQRFVSAARGHRRGQDPSEL